MKKKFSTSLTEAIKQDAHKTSKKRAFLKVPTVAPQNPIPTKKEFSAALHAGKRKNYSRFLPIHYLSKALEKKTVTTLHIKEGKIVEEKLKILGKERRDWNTSRIPNHVRKFDEEKDAPIDWTMPEGREHLINRIIPYLTSITDT